VRISWPLAIKVLPWLMAGGLAVWRLLEGILLKR
jgi:hypothetical protein